MPTDDFIQLDETLLRRKERLSWGDVLPVTQDEAVLFSYSLEDLGFVIPVDLCPTDREGRIRWVESTGYFNGAKVRVTCDKSIFLAQVA